MSYADLFRAEARLVILKALADEPDGRLNSSMLGTVLETYAVARPRSWIHAEMRELEQMGAVTITEFGSVLVARLTQRGLDHVEHRVVLDGVKRPSLPEV